MKNCRLKANSFKDKFGNHMYGFLLLAKGQKYEFYSCNKTETKEWIKALKSVVILLDFKEEITIGGLLGKGITS